MPFVEIKDITHSIDLLQHLGKRCESRFDFYLLGLLGLVPNYFYYCVCLPAEK